MEPNPRQICDALRLGDEAPPETFLAELTQYVRRARTVFPEIEASNSAWVERLRAMLDGEESARWTGILEGSDPGDALLVAGLCEHDSVALNVFENTLVPEIDRVLRRFPLSTEQRAEYRQQIRVKVLVPEPPKPARIQDFRGRGRLAGWLRTVSARLVLNAQRRTPVLEPADQILEQLAAIPTAKRDPLRREQFRAVLRVAFQDLSRRERTLLRMRYLQGMTANALARAYNVHESTMSRWLAKARAGFLSKFESQAVTALGDAERASELLSLVESQIDVSLQGLFVSGVQDVDE